MPIDTVVVNASPLITLFRSGYAELLPQLFSRIIVPEAVWHEVVDAGSTDRAALELPRQSWPLRMNVKPLMQVIIWNLGAGETAVLSYSLTHQPARAVIDDQAARRCALTLDIPFFGTGGLLVLAKRRGLLPSVGAALYDLRRAGLWLNDATIRLLQERAHEQPDS